MPDGTLIPPSPPEPVAVAVRPEEAERLREHRAEAEQTHRDREANHAQQEATARAEAGRQQAELRRKASEAMARMAASPGRAPVPTEPARSDQMPPPPKGAPKQGGGER
ncbi:hypothetical protein GCM10029992_36760 [Glycomyces albus]